MKRRGPEMVKPATKKESSDALVVFGMTGDLAYKKIFPALYAMVKRDGPNVPVVGVASSKMTLAPLRKRITDSIKESGKIDDKAATKQMGRAHGGTPVTKDNTVCRLLLERKKTTH